MRCAPELPRLPAPRAAGTAAPDTSQRKPAPGDDNIAGGKEGGRRALKRAAPPSREVPNGCTPCVDIVVAEGAAASKARPVWHV